MNYLITEAERYARVNIDENRRAGFIAGAEWFANRLIRMMSEDSRIKYESQSIREMSAKMSVKLFWECIDEAIGKKCEDSASEGGRGNEDGQ